jgi:CheY-like chemotaxis protein
MSNTDELKRLISQHHRQLQKLKEQEAKFGLHTPTHILTEIEDRTAEIEKLETELEEVGEEERLASIVLDSTNQPTPARSLRVHESSQTREDVNVTDNIYPLSFSDLVIALRDRYPDFKVNKRFFEIKKELENSDKYCKICYLDESDKRGIPHKFYSTTILDMFDKFHREIELSSQVNVTEKRITTTDQILVIDNDFDIRKLLTIYLSSKFPDFTFVEASNAIEAIEQIDLQKPCIVILDLLLPELEGYDVLEFLNSQYEKALTIVTSPRPISKVDIISNYENFDSWKIETIEKPFQVEDLGIKLHTLLSFKRNE